MLLGEINMEILNYEEQLKGSNTIAIFDLVIPALGLTCRKWKLMRSKAGGLFVTSPSYSTEDGQGTKTWHKYVEVNEKRSREFQRAVLDSLKPFIKEDAHF